MKTLLAIAAAVSVLAAAPRAHAGVTQYNWLPGNGPNAEGPYLGDLWTFNCPAGSTVTVTLDTRDDTHNGSSNLDAGLEITDGTGHYLTGAWDNSVCSYAPVCNGACPHVYQQACGTGMVHSLILYDQGAGACRGGGSYSVTVDVKDGNGNSLSVSALRFGGGPKRKLPRGLEGVGTGPLLNDEGVTSY